MQGAIQVGIDRGSRATNIHKRSGVRVFRHLLPSCGEIVEELSDIVLVGNEGGTGLTLHGAESVGGKATELVAAALTMHVC